MKIVAVTLMALSITLLITFLAIDVMLTLYRLDFDQQVNKGIFLICVAGIFSTVFWECWKRS